MGWYESDTSSQSSTGRGLGLGGCTAGGSLSLLMMYFWAEASSADQGLLALSGSVLFSRTHSRHPAGSGSWTGLGAKEVARLLGKSLSSAYALLHSLMEEGFVVKEEGGFRLARQKPVPLEPTPLEEALEELYLFSP